VFVDLYQTVRHGLRIGEDSYSIKSVEHLYRQRVLPKSPPLLIPLSSMHTGWRAGSRAVGRTAQSSIHP